MILDSINAAVAYKDLYASAHPLFPKALEFLSTAHTLPDGRYELEGDELYVTVCSSITRSAGEAQLEAHDNYIDIQVLFSDEETYGWSARTECRHISEPYNPTSDMVFFDDEPNTYITLKKGNVVIFYPSDAHAPLIGNGTVRKAIAKVKLL